MIKPYIGGGFGNKQDVLYEPLNAFLSMSVGGRAVRMEISREETISGTRTRHAIKGVCKGIVTKDGTVLARRWRPLPITAAMPPMVTLSVPTAEMYLRICIKTGWVQEVDCWTVYTSSPTAGAMRAYGIPQADWFAECLTDDMQMQSV